MPSIHESFGLVYVEALSQGLPVIYSKDQGFDGQFPDGEVGYSVDPLNPEDLAEKIKKIKTNYDSLITTLPNKIDQFSWERISTEYAKVYRSIKVNGA